MPNNQNRSNQDFSRFDILTDEELEEILRLDAKKTEGEESDIEMLLYVMEVLAVRRKNSENPRKTAREAFVTFKEYYMPDELSDSTEQVPPKAQDISTKPTKRLRPWLSRLTATAAILALILVSSVTVQAVGIDIWEIIVNWTEETFHFRLADQTEPSGVSVSDVREFSSLQDALYHKSITVPLAPTWIPKAYDLTDIVIYESPMQVMIVAVYQFKDNSIKIQVKKYLDSDPEQIEQSNSLIEEYESDGTIYYIFENHEELKAVWITENYECYIAGALSIDELKDMINSISGG